MTREPFHPSTYPKIMNQNGYYTEAQARQHINQGARNYVNRENQQQSIQQSYAYNLVQKRKNPVYGAVEAIHELGPTGSISGAITSFSDGNIGKGIVFTPFALLDLGYLTKIAAVSKSTGKGGIGAAGDFAGIENSTLRNINNGNGAGKEGVRGGINCVGCAIAVDATVKGRSATALGDLYSNKQLGAVDLSEMFGRPTSYSKFYEILETVQKGGDGTTGIVTSFRSNNLDGHAFNIVNDGGNVRIFDGQRGKEIPMDQMGGYIKYDLKADGFNYYNTTNK